ncbi:unnamed protein product [Enterobius vermicularis]|uniref:G_PROTEIN_RECEP_F1_2 domain-containing protein n=1 Tax=Enterobius vermicularis TaxID=51028 RepID=A0A0N4VM37_ENTVE|nr:unnamed protein product [Enterobius vermicularis]
MIYRADAYVATFGYIIFGVVVAIPNLYFFIKLVKCKKLRSNYGLMVFQLFISFACGVVLGLKGTVRTVKNFLDILGEITSSKTCLYQSVTPLEIWIYFQFATMLLANSIDRLLVVCDPLFYFANRLRIVILLVSLSIGSATILMIALYVTELHLPDRKTVKMCP